MLLANPDDLEGNANHPFLYARVLGIFHTNVVYTGPGMLDYAPRRLEFLWVRWFQYLGCRSIDWKDCRLDYVRFPPVASDGAFGFVDPRDVLRGCHIMQRFAKGRVHPDGIGLSRCAADSNDWHYYYINRCDHPFLLCAPAYNFFCCRFSDRDMIMRYHWGLAAGHIYTHDQSARRFIASAADSNNLASTRCDMDLDAQVMLIGPTSVAKAADEAFNEDRSDAEEAELGHDDHDDDSWKDDEDGEISEDFSDDDMFLAMEEMYGVE
jgi:hypothetical protein